MLVGSLKHSADLKNIGTLAQLYYDYSETQKKGGPFLTWSQYSMAPSTFVMLIYRIVLVKPARISWVCVGNYPVNTIL